MPSIPQPTGGTAAFGAYPGEYGTPPTRPPRRSATIGLAIALAVFVVTTGVATTLRLVTRSDLATEQAATADLQRQVASLEAEGADLREQNDDLAAENADYRAADSRRAATAADVPNLRQVADKHLAAVITVYGNADYLDLTITDSTAAAVFPRLIATLDELGFSPAVVDRMAATRALDGTLRADGHNCNVTWTYHPDDGLQMVFEAVHPS